MKTISPCIKIYVYTYHNSLLVGIFEQNKQKSPIKLEYKPRWLPQTSKFRQCHCFTTYYNLKHHIYLREIVVYAQALQRNFFHQLQLVENNKQSRIFENVNPIWLFILNVQSNLISTDQLPLTNYFHLCIKLPKLLMHSIYRR